MADVRSYTSDELTALLPLPEREANKYTRGVLFAVVGSAQYPGAACLAGTAGQRTGAGYTRVTTAPEAEDLVRSCSPSLVVRSFEGLAAADLPVARDGHPAACVVGCGFDPNDEKSASLVHLVLKHAAAPVLVDGGALQTLASSKGRRLLRRRFVNGWPTVVTPHAGETARLAKPFDLPMDDHAELARAIALAYGVIAAVKGPETFVSDGEQIVRMAEGTPALAKAGTGDVLAGMVGALLAQGLDPLDAAVLGATLHARAGRAAEALMTSIATTAEDVIDAIPAALRSF